MKGKIYFLIKEALFKIKKNKVMKKTINAKKTKATLQKMKMTVIQL